MLSALWREFQSTLPYGSDSLTWAKALQSPIFQSTLPRGSDGKINIIDFLKTYFNPRSLAGATMFLMIRVPQDNQNFNPRSLAGATTGAYCSIPYVTAISIHAPSRERRSIRLFLGRNTDFNPRSLAGATFQIMVNQPSTPISIHAPSRERHICTPRGLVILAISIHAPSRERPMKCLLSWRGKYFNPRSLAGATGGNGRG